MRNGVGRLGHRERRGRVSGQSDTRVRPILDARDIESSAFAPDAAEVEVP